MMRKLLKIVGVLFGLIVVAAIGVYVWASMVSSRMRAQKYETHMADFPIPFPLDPAEVEAQGLTDEAARQLAQQQAVERGKHLVEARYACIACHGENFGGGTMVDAFPIGSLLAPNLTTGVGSRTVGFMASDWDRIVRHGVLQDGTPAVMPSDDFGRMSDQELSDVVSYIRSLPPVDNTVPKSTLGPLGKILVATGQLKFSAVQLASNQSHLVRPPAAEVSVDFGKHLAMICTGCHGPDLSGGKIGGGDPSWPPARNLTPDATGLKGWTYEQFVAAFQDGRRPDGTELKAPMKEVGAFARSMTDTERRALWTYLQSVPPVSKSVPKS